MTFRLFTVLLLSTAAFAESELRTFTSSDGRTLKARVIGYDSETGKVKIQREDNKNLTVSASAFSEKDQAYIDKWNVAQTFLSASKFKLSLERIEGKVLKKEIKVDMTEASNNAGRGAGGIQVIGEEKSTQYTFKLVMENKSDVALKNITMDYRIFYEQQKAVLDEEANKNRPEDSVRPERYMAVDEDKVKEGDARVKSIDPGSTAELSTASITLKRRSASRRWGDTIDLKSGMTGAWVKLTVRGPDGEELVRDIATSASIMKKFPWEAAEAEPATSEASD